MKKLIGKKIIGFKFESNKYSNLIYNSEMDKFLGKLGRIVSYIPKYHAYRVEFKEDFWSYPAALIVEHIVEEKEENKKIGNKLLLINFLFYLSEKGLINNYDFDYEKQTKKYLKSLKK